MGAKNVVRAAMVVMIVVVLAIVWTSWEGRPDEFSGDGDTNRAVNPETRAPSVTGIDNGVVVYELRADTRVQRRREIDGQDRAVEEFTGDVNLVIYRPPEEEDGLTETTVITAHTLIAVPHQIPVEDEQFESIELLAEDSGDPGRVLVNAILPSGVSFVSERLRYRDRRLLTDEGVLLNAGGLLIESRSLRHDTDTGIARLSGDHPASRHPELGGAVRLWSDESGEAAALGLRGSSGELLYDSAAAELRLRNQPSLQLPAAELAGGVIVLQLDDDAAELRSMAASEGARATWLGASSPGEHAGSGDRIDIDIAAGEATRMVVVAEPDSPRPDFSLGDAGTLRADRFEVALGDAIPTAAASCGGAAAAIMACGSAFFFPAAGDSGLVHIGADVLSASDSGAAALDARGDVEIRLRGADDEALVFQGPEADFAYADGSLTAAEWPRGLRHESEGREVTASHGAYRPASGDWLLDGSPRPTFSSAEFDVTADEVWLRAAGAVDLVGSVSAGLRGDVIQTLGVLFDQATQIEAAADSLHVDARNGLVFEGAASVWEGDGARLLRADQIRMTPGSGEIQATGNVFASLANPDADPSDASIPDDILLSANGLLVQDNPLQLRMAGSATVQTEGAEGRTIAGNIMVIDFLEDGSWEKLEVQTGAVMTDPAGVARGERLEYFVDSGEIVIHAAANQPATFISDQVDIRDGVALRMTWEDDLLRVRATQNGTTQTVRSRQR